jgi:hypothetical protein
MPDNRSEAFSCKEARIQENEGFAVRVSFMPTPRGSPTPRRRGLPPCARERRSTGARPRRLLRAPRAATRPPRRRAAWTRAAAARVNPSLTIGSTTCAPRAPHRRCNVGHSAHPSPRRCTSVPPDPNNPNISGSMGCDCGPFARIRSGLCCCGTTFFLPTAYAQKR